MILQRHVERSLGGRQLQALLKKTFLLKMRNKSVTFGELFSPMLIMMIWVLAYVVLSNSIPPPRDLLYVEPELDFTSNGLPGLFWPSGDGSPDFISEFEDILNIPLPPIPFDLYVGLSELIQGELENSDDNDRKKIDLFLQSSKGAKFFNLVNTGTIGFAPKSDAVDRLVDHMKSTYEKFQSTTIRIYEDEATAVDHIHNNPETLWGLIVIDELEGGKVVNYTIRMNDTVVPRTNKVWYPEQGLHKSFHSYILSGFLTLQDVVDRFVFLDAAQQADSGGEDSIFTSWIAAPFPTPSGNSNKFYETVGFTLALGAILATLFPMSGLVKVLVEEKETRRRETLLMMGLLPWVYTAQWVLPALVTFMIIALTVTLVSTVFFPASSVGVLFCFFLLLCLSEISLAYLVSVFFSRAKLASLCGPIVLFTSVVPSFLFMDVAADEAVSEKMGCSLLSSSAFSFGSTIISSLEKTEIGAHWDNVAEGEGYTLQNSLMMMLLDTCLYAALAWYLEQVLPSEFGTRRPIGFLFTSAYWYPHSPTTTTSSASSSPNPAPPSSFSTLCAKLRTSLGLVGHRGGEARPALGGVFSGAAAEASKAKLLRGAEGAGGGWGGGGGGAVVEPVDASWSPALSVKGLRKTFGSGAREKRAVDGLDLDMYEGQITCLLGHNGAGKSTTMSMLTGLIPPSSGDCVMFGNSIVTDSAAVRASCGVCPQHDVLFDQLTVREHLELLAVIKGVAPSDVSGQVEEMIRGVGLEEKVDVFTHALSGGMKRKVSVGMALIGGSKVVFLDEPTSGMDPYSRRATWDVLRRNKQGRVIVLTTHFMDEADLLGDRIAVMAAGRLMCCGSGLFLKSRYGVGYTLTVVRSDESGKTGGERREQKFLSSSSLLSHTPPPPLGTTRPGEGGGFSGSRGSSSASEDGMRWPLTSLSNLSRMLSNLSWNRSPDSSFGSGGGSVQRRRNFMKSQSTLREVAPGIQGVVMRAVPCAELLSCSAGEIAYRLPLDSVSSFPALLERLEKNKRQLGVGSYGMSTTTLEEVFLRLGELAEAAQGAEEQRELANKTKAQQQQSEVKQRISDESVSIFFGGAPPAVKSGGADEMDDDATDSLTSIALTEIPEEGSLRLTSSRMLTSLLGRSVRKQGRFATEVGERDKKQQQQNDPAACEEGRKKMDEEEVWEEEGPPAGFWMQLRTLLQKRRIIASRDRRGVFFQVGSPALLVLVILLLLSVNLGHDPQVDRLLDYSMFNGENELLCTEPTDEELIKLSSSEAVPQKVPGADTSYDLSEHLIAEYYDHHHIYRVGAVAAGDTLTYRVKYNPDYSLSVAQRVLASLDYGDTEEAENAPEGWEKPAGWLEAQGAEVDGTTVTASPGVLLVLIEKVDEGRLLGDRSYSFSDSHPEVVSSLKSLDESCSENQANELIESANLGKFTTDLPHVGEVEVSLPHLPNDDSTLVDSVTFDEGRCVFVIDLEKAWDTVYPNGTSAEDHWAEVVVQPIAPTVLHNSTAIHGLVTAPAEMVKASYRRAVGKADAVYAVHSHPMSLPKARFLGKTVIITVLGCLFMLIPFSYVPASYAVFVVRERGVKAKHLQFVSGVEPRAYWLSSFLWDYSQFVLMTAGCLGVGCLMQLDPWVATSEHVCAIWLLMMSYGVAAIASVYAASFLFTNPSEAQVSIMGFNFATGLLLVLACLVLYLIETSRPYVDDCLHLFRLFPPFNFGEGVIRVVLFYYLGPAFERYDTPLSWDVAGRSIACLVGLSLLFAALTMAMEGGHLRRALASWRSVDVSPVGKEKKEEEEEDEDVRAERLRVEVSAPDTRDNMVFVDKLRKSFPARGRVATKHAVRGLCLSIPKGQVFGFLGINGAGKTTTMSMLTGDCLPTSGTAHLHGLDVVQELPLVRRHLGYCPQFDPLLGLMTARETLRMYATLKGIRAFCLEEVVEQLLLEVGLGPHMDRECGTYSGGNKRKLSLAMALICRPSVVFLDEPSTGMDPTARRHMWDVVARYGRERSILLTTHSMEECEALCGRICIMVGGRMQCLGSSQHLKGRFGGGYMLEVKLEDEKEVGAMHDFVAHSFKGRLQEFHGARLKYHLPGDEGQLSLSAIFRSVEANREALRVEYYSLSQATLEQIFVDIAKNQEEETSAIAGIVNNTTRISSSSNNTGDSGETQQQRGVRLRRTISIDNA